MSSRFYNAMLVCVLLYTTLSLSAKQYCDEPLVSRDGHNATVTMRLVSSGLYEFSITTEDKIASWNANGSNFFTELNGVGGTQVSASLVKSGDYTLSTFLSSNVKPNFYVGDLFIVLDGIGEDLFSIPLDADWEQCAGAVSDDAEAPVITAAVISEVTHNSAVLTVTATDNNGVVSYAVSSSGEVIKRVAASPIILDLAANTTYSLTVVAYDAAGNASEPFAVEPFTTEALHYCQLPTGMNGDADWGDPNGRILLTIRRVSDSSVSIMLEPAVEGSVIDFFTVYPDNVAADAPAVGSAGSEQPVTTPIVLTGLASLDVSMNIFWHTKGMDAAGRWVTGVFTVHESELCAENVGSGLPEAGAVHSAGKIIRDGSVLIRLNGSLYTISGTRVE
ncbi:MAG: fibronectin type III domain-containing protein [Paludibacteraceae bacterium]|nr:fibronectin type III domain-containing protein [Paludibacteraceae bacterium]